MSDPEKVQCKSCGVMILATTAESNDGYCKPCQDKFSTKATPNQEHYKESLFETVLSFLVPIGFIAFFLFGVPFGYKLVLGGRKSSIKSGTTQSVILINEIPDVKLDNRPARIVSDYLIIELESGRSLWIPEENVAGIEFKDD